MQSARRLRAGTYGFALALALVSGRANSQTMNEGDPATRTAARDLAGQGAEAFDQRQYQVALDLFQRAAALVRAPTIALMQARCLKQLGRWVEAIDAYEVAQHLPIGDGTNPAFQSAIASAADEERALRTRLPRLNVHIEGLGTKEVEVLLDERKLPAALVGVDMPVDPGAHQVEARSAGRETVKRDVVLREGAREILNIALASATPPTVAPTAGSAVTNRAPPAEPARHSHGSSSRTLSWVALGVGSASVATGVLMSALALSKRSELDDVCRPGCPPSYRDDISRYRTYRTLSYATIGFGVATVATGVGFLIFGEKSDTSQSALRFFPGGATFERVF